MTSTYISLAKALQRNGVSTITSFGPGYASVPGRSNAVTQLGPLKQPARFSRLDRANYDLGHLLDRRHSDWIGDAVYSNYCEEGYSRLLRGDFVPPNERCVYVFRCVEDEWDWDRAYCLFLESTSNEIEGSIFFRQEGASDFGRRWTLDSGSFCLRAGGEITYSYDIPRPHASQQVIDMITHRTQITVDDMIVATMLIMSPVKVVDTIRASHVPSGNLNRRRRLGIPNIEAPTIVRIDRPALAAQMTTDTVLRGQGAPKTPHMRRAHVRVIWRGTEKEREVRVKESVINGGKPMQNYRVSK
jgi:hypothetical protein